jgi:flagellar M-ring protein FliF
LTNQPPEAAVAQPPGAQPARPGQAGADATSAAGSRQSTRNYEIDRTLAYTRQPAGRLTRLSVAVLVDNVRTVGADGKVTEAPLSKEQLDRMTALVRDAVGFDAQRGDTVNVMNSPWKGQPVPAAEELESIPVWEQPWARDIAKILAGLAIALVLVFVVLRPLLRQLMAGGLGGGGAGPQGMLPGGQGAIDPALLAAGGPAAAGANLAYEQQVAQARSLVSQDPARVAQVVKTWVSNDG